MIGVGAPFILGAAIFGALLTCVLHFLSVRRPPVLLLPTMRFLPERPVRAVSRSARPSDLWLLLLRVAALLLAGVALSGVTWRGTGVRHGRIVVLQRGTESNVAGERTQMARALEGGFAADTIARIVIIDSVAHLLTSVESRAFRADTLSATKFAPRAPATLSAAILAATRAAGELVRESRNVDALDLVIAAPSLRESVDAAFPAARAMWPGAIRFVDTRYSLEGRDSGYVAPFERTVVLMGATANDAVRSAFQVRGWLSGTGASGARAASTDAMNAKAAPDVRAPISVEWPASGTPEGWTTGMAETIGGLVARGEALVFPFVRSAHIPESVLAQGRAIAWWSDGEVAAIEVPTATSCTRHVGVSVPSSSDVLQGQAARALLLALSGPCGGEVNGAPMLVPELRALEGSGGAAAASAFQSAAVVRTPWAAVLLLLALALLVAEWFVRDREERLNDAAAVGDVSMRKVA